MIRWTSMAAPMTSLESLSALANNGCTVLLPFWNRRSQGPRRRLATSSAALAVDSVGLSDPRWLVHQVRTVMAAAAVIWNRLIDTVTDRPCSVTQKLRTAKPPILPGVVLSSLTIPASVLRGLRDLLFKYFVFLTRACRGPGGPPDRREQHRSEAIPHRPEAN